MARPPAHPPVACPKTGKPLSLSMSEPPPAWVRDGVKLKVKATANTRVGSRSSRGLTVRVPSWGDKNDSAAWAGEEGVIKQNIIPHKTEEEVRAGGCYYGGTPYVAGEGGYYTYTVEFSRGRTYLPHRAEDWNLFVRVKDAKEPTP